MTQEEIKELWDAHESDAEWEEYDFVDPPYCWAASVNLEVDGYTFEGDGIITFPDIKEVTELWCNTPDGQTIKII